MLQELALGREELRIYFVDRRFHSKKVILLDHVQINNLFGPILSVKKFHMEKPPNS